MAHLIQTTSPIIPVIDERLNCLPAAPREHKAKVDQYNELLEVIYEREVELARIKSSLIDMHRDITEEVHHLENIGVLPPDSAAALGARSAVLDSDSEAENVLSDSSGSTGEGITKIRTGSKPASGKNATRKVKGKFGRLGGRHSKVPEAQLAAEWDEKLELGRGGGNKGSREEYDDIRV
ncbi:hypothetical protein CPB83DRAFT_817612 [Crepidotus variabilis]|uniref:Uncharacterized protein n=1 Tax=Crepidotus variabilis TaxID=179855 RepID=A0A9P6JM81_9AGAR|nr:hypothetical protein CPB83DRAFT_817612 [Crepidotus variabilis]